MGDVDKITRLDDYGRYKLKAVLQAALPDDPVFHAS